MKVQTATFTVSALSPEQCPTPGPPEIAFAGRSNVGKSTLLNRLLGKKGLARTSNTPGRTRTINFFEINHSTYFVDLPGYGYAKVPKKLKAQWRKAMTDYLGSRDTLRLAVHLVDARHSPTQGDLQLLELLDTAQVPTVVVATKIDKVKKTQLTKNIERVRNTLELDQDALIIPVSATTGQGIRELWDLIDQILTRTGTRSPASESGRN